MLLIEILYSVTIYAAMSVNFLIIIIFVVLLSLLGKPFFRKQTFYVTHLTTKVTSYRS